MFELCWLITGTVWVAGIKDTSTCDSSIFIFSLVVMVNFWIHILTPLVFMLCVCCSRLVCSCSNNVCSLINNAVNHWTRLVR